MRAPWRLVRKAVGVGRTGAQHAGVVLAQFCEAQIAEQGAGCGDPGPGQVARNIGVEALVVVHHHHAIAGDTDVKFQRRDAGFERAHKTGQGVLGGQATRAAVALQVEGRARTAAEQSHCGGADEGADDDARLALAHHFWIMPSSKP